MMTEKEATVKKGKKQSLMQSDMPSMSISQALKVIEAIANNYGSNPTSPLNIAVALDVQPTTGPFRMLCGASLAYGLTSGSYGAAEIEITELGKRIVTPTIEDDDLIAKKQAFLKPRVIGEFLGKYDKSPLPKDNIAANVLVELGVPRDRALKVFNQIKSDATSVGLLKTIKDRMYVDLNAIPTALDEEESEKDLQEEHEELIDQVNDLVDNDKTKTQTETKPQESEQRKKRVFITHGKNKKFVDPIKKLLAFGELEPVVSVEKQSVSKPVPDKVMSDMRDCGAAIIHVEDEQKLLDGDANEVVVLNPNVLIEIGAAMGLYGKRFILLVKEGVQLPSNLQGLFEVRYKGETLDGDATIRLLEAINEMKKISI